LMSLSDELHKVDTMVENVVRKIAQQLFDLAEVPTGAKGAKGDIKPESLTVNNNTMENYLTFFRWEKAKYPQTQPLKALTDMILVQVVKLDEELKKQSSEYTNLTHALNAEERKASGNLLIKDLSDIVQQKHVLESEYMDTLFICVPKHSQKQFLVAYEKFAEFVVPRSAELIVEDTDYGLYKVVVFKKCVDDFKTKSRDLKYMVRDFKFDPNRNAKADKSKLEAQKDLLKKNLTRWCKTNFSEGFAGWIHLKAIRVFVESVLRYGLPTNFQAMLILPRDKGKIRKLRTVLSDLYSHLSSKIVFVKGGEDQDEIDPSNHDKFYPYVCLDINLDFRKQQI